MTNVSLNLPINLTSLSLNGINISNLDFSNTPFTIQNLYLNSMLSLSNVNLKDGFNFELNGLNVLSIDNCPNLNYFCLDEGEMDFFTQRIIELNLQNQIQFNSYCSFTPGGTFYSIQGQQKFDNENDNCDVTDNFIPNFKYSITDGTTTGTIIFNNIGTYSIPVQAGLHTVVPIFENPSYFTVSPPNVMVDFPTQTSPFFQDFCVAPNGIHHDVEVSILPTNVARPGFDANYKIIYKNKGNQTENGVINLQFNDAVLDLVSTNPAFTSQTINNLTFNYSNLLPFETREINVVFNVNSPMETPAVNSGDILNYTVTNTIANIDEMLSDNTFVLNQTVVNSYDPNDKTCLEGNTISPDRVGGFVHYMIRFENTGTFPAENIVVKDMIDIIKFDVSSLVPLDASHNYVTKITDNKVEFIFENINLPFDDANNDGYIAFKIKTVPTLVLGNTFSNSANIYFDYNFPIVTNTATTTIAALSNPSFEFASYFSLYPNPTTNELNINLKSAIEINSIQIYNTIGQLVITQTGNALKVDVSNLKTGNYFIKINTNEGYSTSQFIKE
ncbi:T9SS type A sorting domain-containing protein [Flavobacterium bernardetii]|uniref:T9SS type A sorting domain-containing protein n=1 Tax=Flavobacterium bernardetii TaxID=2813823 RepID=UPI001CEC22DE|nr:T9SS type A sorting domain-containing protein [Flavobacterium bernardetii]